MIHIIMQHMTKHIHVFIATLKDANLTNKDIYLIYIAFQNTFRFIEHA